MEHKNVEGLLSLLTEKDMLQGKQLVRTWEDDLTEGERLRFDRMCAGLLQSHSVEFLADSYLLFVYDTRKETKFFLENGTYRYSKFSDVNEQVYGNEDYMGKYMVGLQISGYLWLSHILIRRWYSNKIKAFGGGGIS